MTKFNSRHSTTSVRRHRTLIATLAVLLVGGVGFAATGGTETVKRLFVTLKLAGPNGVEVKNVVIEMTEERVDDPVTIDLNTEDGQQGTVTLQRLESVMLGADGEASGEGAISMTVKFDAGQGNTDSVNAMIISREGEPASMRIDNTDDEAPLKTMTITLGDTADAGAALSETFTNKVAGERQRAMLQAVASDDARDANATGGAFSKLPIVPREVILQQMDDSESVAEWFDDDGALQELFVLPRVSDEPAAAGFHLVTAYVDENGEQAFRLIGNVAGVDPETTELSEIHWNDHGLPTLLFVTDEGREISLQIDPDNALTDEKTMIRIEITDDGATRTVRDLKQAPDDR